jgi:hypothetical protein
VNGAAAAGAATVAIDGLTPSIAGTGKRGDFIKFNGHSKVYQLTADADANGSGQATLAIMPALLAALADNEPIVFSSVPFTLILAADTQDLALQPPTWGTLALTRSRTHEPRRERGGQAEWAKAQNAPAHLVQLQFDAGDGGTVYITDSYRTIVFGGNSYLALGALLDFSGVNESVELRVADAQLTLQGVDQSYIATILQRQYLYRRLLVYKAFMGDGRRAHRRPVRDPRRPHGRAEDRRGPRQRQVHRAAALARPVRRLRAHHRPPHQPERPGALVPERPRLRPDRAARGAAAALHLGPLAAAGALGPFPGMFARATPATAHRHLMRFQAEPFERWHKEAAPMFRAHWELVGRHKEEIPLEVDVERWVKSERAGLVAAFTARTQWRLDGYALYLTAPSLNYRGRVFAYCHAIYIEPRELEGLKACASRASSSSATPSSRRGCVKSVMHMKLAHDFGRMVARLGYEESERLWEKVL